MLVSEQIDGSFFPGNVIEVLVPNFRLIGEDVYVADRPLRPTDPNFSIGVFAALWQPNDDSVEMGRPHPSEPTLQQYQLGIHTLVKHGDENEALKHNAWFANRVRNILYRDNTVRVALSQLAASDGYSTERFRRSVLNSQRFMNNEIDSKFVYLSVLDMTIETEKV